MKISPRVPWGYKDDPDDPERLIPIDEQLECLIEAIYFLKSCSSRAVATWLVEKTGRPISHTGLLKIIDEYGHELIYGTKEKRSTAEAS